jgi:hypothetical protein
MLLVQLKTFCEALQGMRSAINLLCWLQSCKDGGPPTAHILQVAMALGDRSPALDTLEDIETCIDRSGKVPRLRTPKQVHGISFMTSNYCNI